MGDLAKSNYGLAHEKKKDLKSRPLEDGVIKSVCGSVLIHPSKGRTGPTTDWLYRYATHTHTHARHTHTHTHTDTCTHTQIHIHAAVLQKLFKHYVDEVAL